MKTFLVLAALVACAFHLGGCGKVRAAVDATPEPAPAATYKAGHGVQLTAAARQFAGLATAEVGTRAFAGADTVAAVPRSALLRTVRGDFVYVANGAWFLRTPVITGATDTTHVEIKEGLYEGDTIVVRGVRALSLAEIQALNGGVGCADGH
ncbi:MAG: hypothetical protein HYV96_06840 [Opitutae bacterium]|nr:hypothetical protein [Opitutae bacterium]